jgi:hypothetical protein
MTTCACLAGVVVVNDLLADGRDVDVSHRILHVGNVANVSKMTVPYGAPGEPSA